MARKFRNKSRRYKAAQASAALPRASAAAYTAGDPAEHTMRNWYAPSGSADSDLIPELGTMVPRSRDLARNHGIASGAMQTYKDNIIGHVLRLASKPHYKLLGIERERAGEIGRVIENEFETWANTTECDAGRTMTLLGQTLQSLGSAMLNGEALALPLWRPRAGSRWAMRIQSIEADRLATPPWLENNPNVRGGVEIDRDGAPVAYWIQRSHPGDRFGLMGLYDPGAYQRIPAFTPRGMQRVIHLHDKERSGQNRGRPIVSSVMKEFRLAGKYTSAHLETAVASSLIAAFLESDLPPESAAELFGEDPAKAWEDQLGGYHAQLQGAAVIPVPAGARITPFTPSSTNDAFGAFMESALRHIATGLNMPYELLLKDFSKTNYSSARAALLEAWRFFHGRRRWIKDYWLRPIYELWLDEAIARGRIPGITQAEYHANRYAYARANWVFAGRGWVDPVKEAKAAEIRMQAGLSTLEQECAEQGLDWEEVLEQRARERDFMASLNLLEAAQLSAATPYIPEPGETAGNTEDTQ
jgi:lambda family phage portal protein